MIVGYLNKVTVVAMAVVAMVVVAIYVGFIGFEMGANGGRAQMGVDTIRFDKTVFSTFVLTSSFSIFRQSHCF